MLDSALSQLSQILKDLGYEYLDVQEEQELFDNLRKQIERLNTHTGIRFTDSEWEDFFKNFICKRNSDIEEKLEKIQGYGYIKEFINSEGVVKNLQLIDKENICNNHLQFIDRYSKLDDKRTPCITILVNGLPMIDIEISDPRYDLESIFEQLTNSWKQESFGAKEGFFDFIEMFIISNIEETKYFSCTTLENSLKVKRENSDSMSKTTNNSFLFTTFWSDHENKLITKLEDFARSFLPKSNILDVIINFSILTKKENGSKELRIMRPYQIYATKRIIQQIQRSFVDGKLRTTDKLGGYVWHATGSGKTLTSFKACSLARKIKGIEKVLFVVDRKDLDFQTQKEFESFEKNASQRTENTSDLWELLKDSEKRIITTTIQKLSHLIKRYPDSQDIFTKNTVIIFDECHRTQSDKDGGMHKKIKENFVNSWIFGFTGTPIMTPEKSSEQSVSRKSIELEGTKQLFGEELHRYTLLNAINDQNVLKIQVSYIGDRFKNASTGNHHLYDTALIADSDQRNQRISEIVRHILKHFDDKTLRPKDALSVYEKRKRGYNSILTVSSIEMAKQYYREFKKQLEEVVNDANKLFVTTIYTSQENNPEEEDSENYTSVSADGLDRNDRKFLEDDVFKDYEKAFGSSFSLGRFDKYYNNVAAKVRTGEIDLLIVVNMFLTGFDAPCLNTLWVDKFLQNHGLVQAFSRTNRIYKKSKTHGNVICFRTSEQTVNEAFNKYAGGAINTLTFDQLYEGYIDNSGQYHKGYREIVNELKSFYNNNQNLEISGGKEMDFLQSCASFMKLRNTLRQYYEFQDKELANSDFVNQCQAKFLNLVEKSGIPISGKREEQDIKCDQKNISMIWDGIEVIKQVEITVEHLISLIVLKEEWDKLVDEEHKKRWQNQINTMMDSATNLRKKRSLVNEYIDENWECKGHYINFSLFASSKLEDEVNKLIQEENIKKQMEFKKSFAKAFRNKKFVKINVENDFWMPVSKISWNLYHETQERITSKLEELFEKYVGFIGKDLIQKWLNLENLQ